VTLRAWMAPALLLLFASSANAVNPEDLLSASQAFKVSGVRAASGEIYLTFDIAPGYALYRDKIRIGTAASSPAVISTLTLPHGTLVADPDSGAKEQWRSRAIATLTTKTSGPVLLAVKIQGCADVGVCFNPEVREVLVR